MARIIGREGELAAIRGFLRSLPQGSRALVLTGDAGIGKTTLLRSAVAEADALGYALLRSTPSESESEMAFAVLGDLFRGLGDDVWASLSGPPGAALRIALLQDEPDIQAVEPHAIALGVLRALQHASNDGPILVVIDDAHWCDSATWRALQFALRRLIAEPVGFLFSWRTGNSALASLERVAALGDKASTLRLLPMSLETLDLLLRTTLAAAFSRGTLSELHSLSAGNPFFALEIGRYVLAEGVQLIDSGRLPIPRDLSELVLQRVRRLPSASRRLMLAMAALGHTTDEHLTALFNNQRELSDALQAAIDAGLIETDGSGYRFGHPLVGSVVYQVSPAAERRELHRAIARVVTDVDEKARHLGLAAQPPDSNTASLLEESAVRIDRRGAPQMAALMMQRAIELTPPEHAAQTHRRSIVQADYLVRAGESDRARELLESLLKVMPRSTLRVRALHRLGRVLATVATMEQAAAAFTEGLADEPMERHLRAALERDLTSCLNQMARPRSAQRHAAVLAAIADELEDEYLRASILIQKASVEFFVGHGVSPQSINEFRATLAGAQPRLPDPPILDPLLMCAALLKWSDSFDEARILLHEALDRIVDRHEEEMQAPVLFHLGELELWAGNLAEAARHARECEAATRMVAQPARRHLARLLTALVDLHSDRLAEALRGAEDALADADSRNDMQFVMRASAAKGMAHLVSGNFQSACEAFGRAASVFEDGGYDEPGLFRFEADRIESLIGAGEIAEASRRTAWLEEQAKALERRSALATGARSRGLLLAAQGELASSLESLARALLFHESFNCPIELARTHLAHGIVLRKAKQKRRARIALQNAIATSQRVGAATWEAKARREMERLGMRPSGPDGLTPTELKVAELAASGRSNAEIARAMFLSVKSVEASLTRVYQKMGVRSRTQMAARLGSEVTSRVSPDS